MIKMGKTTNGLDRPVDRFNFRGGFDCQIFTAIFFNFFYFGVVWHLWSFQQLFKNKTSKIVRYVSFGDEPANRPHPLPQLRPGLLGLDPWRRLRFIKFWRPERGITSVYFVPKHNCSSQALLRSVDSRTDTYGLGQEPPQPSNILILCFG